MAHSLGRVGWLLIHVMLTDVRVLMVRGFGVCSIWVSMPSVGIHVLVTAVGVWVVCLASCVWINTVGRVAIWGLMLVGLLMVNLSLHVAVVLLGTDVVMLITLLRLLALLHRMLWSGLGLNGLDMRGLISMRSMKLLLVVRLHLEN